MTEKNIAVVILNYNGKSFLKKFLPGVVLHSPSCNIYVADNCSSDDSVSFLKEFLPEVRILQNTQNYGYALGYNKALEQLKEEFFVLLNSDVEVSPFWIEPVINLLLSDRSVAVCQPKLLDEKNKSHFEYAGASGGYIDRLAYPFCRGRLFNELEKDEGQYNDVREVFWASGACLFVRADAFREAGGLDPDYFAHMEEIDLCWRLKNIGYKVMVVPDSVVYHLGGGTLNKQSTHKTYLNFRNNLCTLFKNERGFSLCYKIPTRLVLDGLAGFKFLIDGQALHTLAVLRAHFAFYFRIISLIKKRSLIRKHPHFKTRTSMIYKGSIVFEYFLMGRKNFKSLRAGFFS